MSLKRILVCDDSLTIRRLVSMVASGLGIEFDLAVNAAEGVAKARSGNPDLILLDYVLPDGKGQDVLDQLERSEATAGIPVVMMSAKGETLVDKLGNRRSVVGFLNKPFRTQDLEQLLAAQRGRTTATPAAAPAATATPAGGHGAARGAVPNEAASVDGSVAGSMASQAEGLLHRIDDPTFAKLLFKVLRGELGRLAEWLGTVGARVEVGELAKRLIKPSVVRDLRAEIEQACPDRRRPKTGILEICRPSIPERVPGFSSRVVGVPLRDTERAFLGLVDGERSVGDIERELRWSAPETVRVLDTVSGLGLVRLRSGLVGGTRPGTLWLLDELPGEFAKDLAHHLGRFGRRWQLVRMRSAEAIDEAQRSTPDGILVHCTMPDSVAALRAVTNLERIALAAVFDDSQLSASALLGAGADLALALPVRTAAIESFLSSTCCT